MDTFQNRKEAGQQLAKALAKYKGEDAIVCSLPRGGVVVGAVVARELSLPHEIIAVRKIGHPANKEYAIGAVDSNGTTLFNEKETKFLDKEFLEQEVLREKAEAERRLHLYRQGKKPIFLKNKIVIIVDDGIATGLTIRLATRVIKNKGARKIVVAAPVAHTDSIQELKSGGADEILVLVPPEKFRGAVGAHYLEFPQTSDQEVKDLLGNGMMLK